MYNSNKSNNSGSFSGSGKSDGPNGSSSRFQNKNLNSSVKAPAAPASSKPGLAVIRGNKGVGKSIGGAAAPTATLAPVPLNTPSAKRENNGRDPNVNIVQPRSTGGVWGQTSSSGAEDISPVERGSAQPASALSKPAPWAKTTAPAASTEGNAAAATESSSAKTASFRPQTASWADVDIDSEDDDDDAPRAPAHAPASSTGVSRVVGTVQAARPPEAQSGFGYNNLSQSNDYRKERSGSFNNEPDRRFGGFPNNNNNSFQPQDDRFNHNNNNRGFGSGDARFGGQQGPGDFGRPGYGGGGQFSNGFGNSPNNLNAMRNNNNNNSFSARGPPLNQFAGNPPPFPQQGQRPPPGDFSRGGGNFGGAQGYGFQGQGQSQASGDPALRAIEEARNEVQELEAKKLRKRTMSSEEYAPASAPGPTSASTAAPVGHVQGQDRDFDHHRDQQGQAQGFRRDNYPPQGQGQGQGQGQDSRWGGPQRGGPDDYHHNNNNNNNSNFYGAGHGQQGGYGYGGEAQRVPYRTRGPSFDNSGPEGANRSFGTGGNVPLHGQQYPLDAQHHQGHHQVQSEPMWERVKVPMPVQQQPPQFQRLQPPYGGADPAGDRWNQRQQLPPPPALHMNAHYANLNPNGPPNGVPPSGYRPERERGPRSGNTPREGEADRAAAPASRAVATASPVVSDRRAASNASPYDPSKSFSSLFGGKAPQEGAYAQQEGQSQNQGHAVSKQDYPLPHEEVIRANRVYNPASAPEAPHAAPGYQPEQRAFGSPATSGGPRQKMLFDPQSNEYRPLEKDTAKAPYASKVPTKKPEGRAGPPASEDAAEDKASVLRKTLQVNRIEQNTSADKWSRGKESAPAVEAASHAPARPVHTVRPHTEGNHEETETYEQGRDEYLAERKALRLKERQERGPRTKGFLFRFTADGNIERVLTAEELEAKTRKAERAAAPRQTVTKRSAEDGAAAARVELTNFDHLDFDNLTKEEFQSLPKAKKEEIRAKHAADKAARRTGGAQDAREGRDVRESREPREVRETRPPRENRLPQYGTEPEDLNVGSLNLGYSAPSSSGLDHGDLDIQQMARENDAHRSLQPIKAFVPGQGYGGPLDAPPHQPLMQNWREGAQVIPAARIEQHQPHPAHQQHQGHPAHLQHQHQQQPYPAIVQPHSYPIIHQPHQPVVNLGHDQQSWNFPSYVGASEPALFGGNTSFLGQQESTIDQRFSALQSLRSDADVEITESYEAREHRKGATIARERGPAGPGPAASAPRREEPHGEREFAGRGAGRGERAERPGRGVYAGRGRGSYDERPERPDRADRVDRPEKSERFERPRSDHTEDGATPAPAEREAHGGRFGGRSGRGGGGRGPPAEEGDHSGDARGRGYAGRGGRGEGRGEGRGRGAGRGGRGGREFKPRAGPPSEPVAA